MQLTLRAPPTTAWGFLIPVGPTSSVTKDIVELARIKPKYTVGRGNDNDLVVRHPAISALHCILRQTMGSDGRVGAVLEDFSRHGTFVNGVRLKSDENASVDNNDVISLAFDKDGPVAFRFRIRGILEMTYEMGPIIGTGAFAVVHSAIEQESGHNVALKIIRRGFYSMTEEGALDVLKEAKIMKRLEHPNIVKLRAAFDHNFETYLVLELFPLGNLHTLVESTALAESDVRSVARDVCRALEYLHSENIVHRDIKPQNILIASAAPLFVKLTDFGLAKDFSRQDLRTICGTPLYMAPEVYVQDEKDSYTTKVDIWALGVTMFKVLSRNQNPWDNPDIEWRQGGQPKPKFIRWTRLHGDYSKLARDFVNRLIRYNPNRRPEAAEILTYDWIMTK